MEQRISRRGAIAFSTLGLGGAAIGGLYEAVDERDAVAAVHAAFDAGVTSFDTAPYYGLGLSETRIGRALSGRDVTVSTKVGRTLCPRRPDEPRGDEGFVGAPDLIVKFDYSAAGVLASIDSSRERLGRDVLDLVLIHDSGAATHGPHYPALLRQVLDEALPALIDARRRGSIRAIGVGVNETGVVMDILAHADLDIVLLSGRYTLIEQGALDDLLPLCVARNIGVIIGGPYNSGLTAPASAPGITYEYDAVPHAILARAQSFYEVAARHGVDIGAAALQFPLAHPAVLSVIPGARSIAEVRANVARYHSEIPATFWVECVGEGLIASHAPVPA